MTSPRKKRRLNDEKCTFCREDSKKCRPKERTWPGEKCKRCTRKGLPCSENLRDAPTQDDVPGVETPPGFRKAASSDEENWSSCSEDQPGTPTEDSMFRMRQPEFPIRTSSERRDLVSPASHTEFAVGSQLMIWSQKAYWLQYLKRVRNSMKDFDIQYRRILNEDGCSMLHSLVDRLHQGDEVTAIIHNLQADSLHGLHALLSGSERSHIAHLATAISGPVFFTRLPDDPGYVFKPADRNVLRKLMHEVQTSGQLDCAIELQECLLLSYREGQASGFSAECRAELKRYQDYHKMLFQGFSDHFTTLLSLPEDHLPFLEHSGELIGMAINCRMFFESTDILGRSLLHVALANTQQDLGQLIKKSPMVHHHDRWGLAPIHLACMNGNAAALHSLLLQGASIVVPVGVDGWLPWHFAAFSGNTLVVEKMLEVMPSANMDINSQSVGKQTALGIAARYGHTDVVRLLLDSGADPRLVDKCGRDALHRAVLWRSHDVAKLLIKQHGSSLTRPEKDAGYTALHVLCFEDIKDIECQATAEDDEKMMHLLLTTNSLDPNSGDENGETALHLAVSEGLKKKQIVKMLVSSPRISLNVRDKDGKTPIFVAVDEGYYDLVKILLDTGRVQLDLKDKDGETALSIARKRGFAELLWLIEVYAGAQKVSQGTPRKK